MPRVSSFGSSSILGSPALGSRSLGGSGGSGLGNGSSFLRGPRRSTINSKRTTKTTHIPVHFGDSIYFKVPGGPGMGTMKGFFNGSVSLRRCGLDQHSLTDEEPIPLTVGGCLFRVFPNLNYKAQEEVERMTSRSKGGARSRAGSGGGPFSRTGSASSFGADRSAHRQQLEIEKQRAAQEIRQNAQIEQRINEGDNEVLFYGSLVQLQHVDSGLFMSCHEGAASKDVDCRRIELTKGRSSCYFRIRPKLAYRREGECPPSFVTVLPSSLIA